MSRRKKRTCGRVFQRPGRPGFYVRVRSRGRERVRYAGPNRTIAQKQLARVEAALAMGADIDAAINGVFGNSSRSEMCFRQLAKAYEEASARTKRASTAQVDRFRLRQVLRAPWTAKRLDEIRPEHVRRWLEARRVSGNRGRGVSSATLNRDRGLIRVVFAWGVSLGHADSNPAAVVPKFDERGRAREAYLDPQEAASLLEHCRAPLRAIVLAALTTGLRRGTLADLRWRHVDLEAGFIHVRASMAKGKKAQRIPVTADLLTVLRELRAACRVRHIGGEDFVFRTVSGRSWGKAHLSRQFRKAVDTCQGIPEDKRREIVFHSLRHSFASWLTLRGVHQRVIQEALAHSTPGLTARYSHLRPGAIDDAIRSLPTLRRDGRTEARKGTHGGTSEAAC